MHVHEVSFKKFLSVVELFDPSHEKTNNLHVQKQKTQISIFVFTTHIVKLVFLNLKFQASSLLL